MNTNLGNRKNWYVFYLRPHTEKKVYRDLSGRNYEVFLPVIKKMSVWRNRQKKIIESPLFPNYIFVHAVENEIYRIERIPKIVTLVRFDRQPATIDDREIGVVRKMINSSKDISVENQLLVGGQVEIISGLLAGCRGILVGQTGKKQFAVQLKEFNHTVSIDINENELRLI